MTVSTVVDHNDYVGNGVTTSFPYTFRIFEKSDLVVTVIDLDENLTELSLDTDYTVTNAGGYAGGSVVLTTALANGWRISIARELEATQETDLRNQGKFFAEVHEDAFDKLTMLIQQTYSSIRLALRKPTSIANWYDALNNYIRNVKDPREPQDAATKNYVDTQSNANFSRTLRVPEGFIPELPGVEQRKNKIVAMDSDGNPIMVLPEDGSAADVLLLLADENSQVSIAGETAKEVAMASKTAKLLSQYSHVSSYSDDNAKILTIFDKENCSLEGGVYNLNDSFDFSGNKRIRVNKDTIINVTGQIDQLFRFLGHVAWDGLGRLTINANHNDKSDRTESILCFPNYIPTINNIDIHGANGLSVLVGMSRFGPGAPVAQGAGHIKDVRTFDCGKGVHVYGNVNKDTTIITENLYTDNLTGYLNGLGVGGGGNTFYLSYHRQAKNIGGYFEHHPDSYGPNINRSLYGAYEGGWFQGADGTQSRGPTFGEDLDYGAIYGGGVSRNCGFAAISADIRKSDGSYPISRVVIDGWTAIGCGRTLYSQAQDLSFGNIHTKESKSSDFLIRINGANPKSVKQIGVITAFNGTSSTKPSLVWADKTSSLYLIPDMIVSDDTVNVNVPVVADNSTSTGSTINIGTQYPIVTSDYLVPNIREVVEVDLSSTSSVLTLRLPAANLSNLKGMQHKVFVRGGNGVKILRITVSNADGTINGSAGPIDFTPSAGSVRIIECLNKGSGNYLVTT